ncbi:MAG: hypothetical protein ACREBU_06860 [Nitrososphaera sp.]
MPTDKFNLSVTQNVDTDASANRPWKFGAIHRIEVVAPAAATTAEWTLKDGSEVPFNKQATHGTAISFEANAFTDVELQAEREWLLVVRHAGAAAQTFDFIVEWD